MLFEKIWRITAALSSMGQFNIGLVKHAYIKIVVSGHLLILN
jgi:hypothetical protein